MGRMAIAAAKMSLIGVLLVAILAPLAASSQSNDCDPAAVREWMVQRQIGRNQMQKFLGTGTVPNVLKALLDTQEIRRNLEDLPRPACADSLYTLTISYYDAISDFFTLEADKNNTRAQEVFTKRSDVYNQTVDSLYLPLQTIAGVDVMATAEALAPQPTAAPTQAPPTPISLSGDKGGAVEGPIDIPAGTYRATLKGVSATASLKLISGRCDEFYMYTTTTNNSDEEIFTSDGCRAMIETDMSDESWTLDLTPVQ